MSQPPSSPITQLLAAANRGDSSAVQQLWSVIYDELRRIARQQLADEAPAHARQPTTLVHEAYFRLMGGDAVQWSDRRHFFGAAARATRQIRVDDARKRNRLKRGGGQRPAALAEEPPALAEDPAEVLAVHEALEELEREDPRKAEVVTLRYFAGLSVAECASAIGVSPRTVDNEWRFARIWLHRELSKGDTSDARL